jgi:predicted ABC-type ATPase
MNKPVCWIIAGPNGAGKTTFALKSLPEVANCRNFVNADLIAAGLAPLAPERELIAASRLFLQEIEHYIARRESFSFETTLSGRSHLHLVRRLVSDGWQVELVYLALPSVEMSALRVVERVAHGGHSVPLDAIKRRFSRSLHNLLYVYCEAVSRTRCFMNIENEPDMIFVQSEGQRKVLQQNWLDLLTARAQS